MTSSQTQAAPPPPPANVPPPADSFQWHESVLSTRSLSYMSTTSDYATPLRAPLATGRNTSYHFPAMGTRKNTLTSISSRYEDEDEDEDEDGEDPDEEVGEEEEDALQMTCHRRRKPRLPSPIPEPAVPALPRSVAESPLFRLPQELRQMIYAYIYPGSNCNPADRPEILWPASHLSVGLQPQLLRTCVPLYAEAAAVLYTTSNLAFAHPSDANMFRHAIASRLSELLTHFTLRVKAADARLWTAYFNSNTAERSLSRDFPNLAELTIRYRGLRYSDRHTEEQNAHAWLKDPKLQEILLSVRKCVGSVKVLLCVQLPEEAKARLHTIDESAVCEKCPQVVLRRFAWANGCYIRAVDVRDGQWGAVGEA